VDTEKRLKFPKSQRSQSWKTSITKPTEKRRDEKGNMLKRGKHRRIVNK